MRYLIVVCFVTLLIFGYLDTVFGRHLLWGPVNTQFLIYVGSVTLYTERYQQGQSHRMDVMKCKNVPDWINNKAESVDTHDTCIKLCTESNCKGRCVEYEPGIGDHGLLEPGVGDYGLFDDLYHRISSVEPCIYPPQWSKSM